MEEYLTPIIEFFRTSGFIIIQAIIIFIFGNEIIKQLLKLVKQGLLASSMDYSMVGFFHSVLNYVMKLALILICVASLGVNLSGLTTALSALGLAVGIAIQDIIGGAANGLMLVNTKPFKVGDYVDIGDYGGTVRDITLMHTVLDTFDNKRVVLTNKTVFNSSIVNYSVNETRRCDLIYGVDYETDILKARKVIMEVVNKNSMILKNPAPSLVLSEMADSSVNFGLRIWVASENYWTVRFDMTEKVFLALKKADINIPYPQVTLNFRPDGVPVSLGQNKEGDK
ncbi:MAG: mechanosensitive ion channel family protein [Sphaerochaetaceae bacterium]|nr:mechanosensitive ion channel family protein [Sphaerochaetaceae bacterium]